MHRTISYPTMYHSLWCRQGLVFSFDLITFITHIKSAEAGNKRISRTIRLRATLSLVYCVFCSTTCLLVVSMFDKLTKLTISYNFSPIICYLLNWKWSFVVKRRLTLKIKLGLKIISLSLSLILVFPGNICTLGASVSRW